ncbi:hypothetical protein BVRB_013400 [Beta vulgaris subsp. vulgaris]|uniref:Uncharacterized protein n=2 Tax=Beta vulgaris subsp. vulgaris TaxID=3555 RepID=A0A0J8DVW1_BETVV|nr:hypothetical protein BVRB_013400 [Beta vulgaris subsp. vulgaris]
MKNPFIGGELGEYKPLHSSVNAKLEAICESLAKQGNEKQQGESGKSKKTQGVTVTSSSSSSSCSSSLVTAASSSNDDQPQQQQMSDVVKAECASDSEVGSGGSLTLSDLTFGDADDIFALLHIIISHFHFPTHNLEKVKMVITSYSQTT